MTLIFFLIYLSSNLLNISESIVSIARYQKSGARRSLC